MRVCYEKKGMTQHPYKPFGHGMSSRPWEGGDEDAYRL